MRQVVSKGLVLFTVILPPVVNMAAEPKLSCRTVEVRQNGLEADPRLDRLEKYFAARKCPVRSLAKDFLAAADKHGLDWRLLPSLSVVESSGGKVYRNNNIFGWANGDQRFHSVKAGIHIVAGELANSRYYRGKSLDQKLYTYNRRPLYGKRVKTVMAQLGPETFDAKPIVAKF